MLVLSLINVGNYTDKFSTDNPHITEISPIDYDVSFFWCLCTNSSFKSFVFAIMMIREIGL